MNHVDRIVGHAEQHCKDHGVRLTAKRKQVLAGLIQSNKEEFGSDFDISISLSFNII